MCYGSTLIYTPATDPTVRMCVRFAAVQSRRVLSSFCFVKDPSTLVCSFLMHAQYLIATVYDRQLLSTFDGTACLRLLACRDNTRAPSLGRASSTGPSCRHGLALSGLRSCVSLRFSPCPPCLYDMMAHHRHNDLVPTTRHANRDEPCSHGSHTARWWTVHARCILCTKRASRMSQRPTKGS